MKRYGRIRGVALWRNLVISPTGKDGRIIAADKESGKIVWDKNMSDHPELELSAAPLALKDDIIVGGSGGDAGTRNWIASLNPKTGDLKWKTYTGPAPGEPGSETWKDKNEAWKTGGGAFYVTGSYDPQTNLTIWGSGNPVPGYDATRRPGDNLFTSSAIGFDVATGKMKWYFQYTPNDSRDYDETGTHVLIDTKIDGQDRKAVTHAGRNGFNYTFDRVTGQFLKVGQYVGKVTWTKGIDPKTGKPMDYDPTKDLQLYAEPATGQQKARKELPYPSTAGTLSTAGGVLITALADGTVMALDDQTLEEVWRINVGTGFNAPPITYSVNGKQYIAIASGLGRAARNKLTKSPEMRTFSNATMIFVFGL